MKALLRLSYGSMKQPNAELEVQVIYCYMCPHTTIYVSSYYYICVLILLYMCPHMCPHTTIYVSSYYYMCPRTTKQAGPVDLPTNENYICVLILLYMCPRTTKQAGPVDLPTNENYTCPHTTIYVSSYY
jgi:hypothetical protein